MEKRLTNSWVRSIVNSLETRAVLFQTLSFITTLFNFCGTATGGAILVSTVPGKNGSCLSHNPLKRIAQGVHHGTNKK